MSNEEETPLNVLAPEYTDAELEAMAAYYRFDMGMDNFQQDDPLIGYGDPYFVPATIDPSDIAKLEGAAPPAVHARDEIRFSDITEILGGLDEDDKDALALEMFAAGVYTDIDDMFDENFQRNEAVFNSVVENTINLAAAGTELGFETTFLKVLMGAGESDRATVLNELATAKAEAAKAKQGGGRVIQWANPQGLVRSLKEESKGTLGRKATRREQKDFVRRIHNMQAKGLSVNVAAEAEAAARESAPVEAGAMDYSNARNAMMQVIMSRVGRVQ